MSPKTWFEPRKNLFLLQTDVKFRIKKMAHISGEYKISHVVGTPTSGLGLKPIILQDFYSKLHENELYKNQLYKSML